MISLYNEYKKVYETSMEQIQNLLLIDLKMAMKSGENAIPEEYLDLQTMKLNIEEGSLVKLEVRPLPFKVSPMFVDQVNNLLTLSKWALEKMEKENISGLRYALL